MVYSEIYKQLIEEAALLGITVTVKRMKSGAKGICKGKTICISSEIGSEKEKVYILAEEIAHCLFTVGNIINQDKANNRIQEQIARVIATERINGNEWPLHLAPVGSYGFSIYCESVIGGTA